MTIHKIKIPLIFGGILLIFSSLFADLRIESNHSRIESAKSPNATQGDSQFSFVFNPDSLLNTKSIDFFNATSNELFRKTGVYLYVYMANNAPVKEYYSFPLYISDMVKKPFIVIILLKNEQKIDIIQYSDILKRLNLEYESSQILTQDDKKKIYWEYMVPLLPQKNNEAGALSAVVFNGYVEAVDLIADKFGVQINHNISKDEKGAKMVAQGILYFMLFSMIGLFVAFYFFKNKRTLK